jgi:hypothetical protein
MDPKESPAGYSIINSLLRSKKVFLGERALAIQKIMVNKRRSLSSPKMASNNSLLTPIRLKVKRNSIFFIF